MLPKNINKELEFDQTNLREIYLAGGCFWGVDAYMARVRGVYSTESGYANGFDADPTTYKEVCTGTTGHTEAVYLKYDITKITLAQLLQEFFSVVDPTTLNRQAGDVGTQYRTGIYYTNPDDLQTIQQAIELQQQNYSKQIVTEVMPLQNYCPAEEYHQNYLEKNPGGYCHIKIV